LKIEGVTGLGNLARVREPLTGSILALLVLLQFGCGGASGGAPPRGSGGTSPAPAASAAAGARIGLAHVATLSSPTAMAIRNGDSSLYFIEQGGRVRRLRDGQLQSQAALDISEMVRSGGELGLLGIAFSPDGGYVYLDYTDTNSDTRIVEYTMRGGEVDRASRRELLFVKQPYPNHKGGQLAFGPDGDLYIGLGDGGSQGDPHDNGQSLRALLGKILRISPRPSGGKPYGIPADNPFVGRTDALPEIWAYGLRNPWRFSFDSATGDLWIADVGQDKWEEIDHQPAGSRGGQNYGWNRLEGTHPYHGQAPANAVPPVVEYSHDGGACSVTGGYVYRRSAIATLSGSYVYGDYCAGWIDALPVGGGSVGQPRQLGLHVSQLSSFGVDQAGALYALSLDGPVYRLVPA
jgi:glucose/arabinose dehydrogenase